MNEKNLKAFYKDSRSSGYVQNALNARRHQDKPIQQLLEKRKWPQAGWADDQIEHLLRELSQMDTNRFPFIAGVGEREGRVYNNLVSRRHFGFSHGIGRSGDLTEAQPKAIGSTILNDITNRMLLDVVKVSGLNAAKKCLLIPMATGMTLLYCLLQFQEPISPTGKRKVLWSRIDQKSCFKGIISAGFEPVVIDTISQDDILSTDVEKFKYWIGELKSDNIGCIISTTSCFAPRGCDDVISLAKLAREHNIPHIVNNAYGLQSSLCTSRIEQAVRQGGRVDFVVQSTDKNLLVPVGASIVVAFEEQKIDDLAKCYAGRASISQSIDIFITLLSMGEMGFRKLLDQQKECFDFLLHSMERIAEDFGERVFYTSRGNRISIAFSLSKYSDKPELAIEIGSRLFQRGITGTRVVAPGSCMTIGSHVFKNWGSHTSEPPNVAYLTVAAALGCLPEEIDILNKKLRLILEEMEKQASQ
ncbi:O-phosphoseryl-tRNA(Sec) selenium transferase [Phlebotomus argentipes]|uniref:O-phosphoseryl-tRNA(Sec) selenium transferase n=1 Tax=Phlebotomus argentipes TaxID=94469 RepID=UPI002892D802|nr:O-phosphoseryl-tRNA(Sec) selenium transferase [Phlebotomus argentipes]